MEFISIGLIKELRELYHTYIQYNKTGWTHFFQKMQRNSIKKIYK